MRSLSRLAVLAAALAACDGNQVSKQHAEAERLWEEIQSSPKLDDVKGFRRANLAAAREHGELNDREGVQYQVRACESQVLEARLGTDRDESVRFAFEVIDRVDELEHRDLLRIYEELLPGSRDRFLAARESARALTPR